MMNEHEAPPTHHWTDDRNRRWDPDPLGLRHQHVVLPLATVDFLVGPMTLHVPASAALTDAEVRVREVAAYILGAMNPRVMTSEEAEVRARQIFDAPATPVDLEYRCCP